jgi:signal transduction histidine kinase
MPRLDQDVELGPSHYALLLQVTRDLSSSLDLGEVLARSLAAVRRVVPFRGGSIALVEEGMLSVAASDPVIGPEVAALRLPLGEGLSGRVALTGRPIYSPDLDEDSRVDPQVRRLDSNRAIRSYYAVPVVAGGDVVGVLQIDGTTVDGFSPTHRALIASIAPLMASAIQNARSYVAELETEERLAEVERMRADFISIVSHELRTPLTALLGFADLLTRLGGRGGPDADQAPHLLARVESAVGRLRHLLGELEHLAGLDAGSIEIAAKPVDVHPIVHDAVDRHNGDHPVVLEVEAALPIVVVDPHRLEEALNALLDNAVKFSPRGSPVTVTACRRGDVVEIAVVDEGEGVPADQAEKVFERFAQMESPSVRRVGGLGLGLPVAKELIERMGGALHLVPGAGGRFVIRLPLEAGMV